MGILRLLSNLCRYPRGVVAAAGFLLTLAVSGLRWVTGPEWAYSVFYLIPVTGVTWRAGFPGGLFISAAGAVSLLAVELTMRGSFSAQWIPVINQALRFTLLVAFSYFIAELKKALEQQKALAVRDPLTGLANRRAFLEDAWREILRARRARHPISLLFMDIDRFKALNDRFGHEEGDRLLQTVGERLLQNTRATDTAARMGGDEFCVLFAPAGPEAATAAAEKIHRLLTEEAKARGWPVQFSIGVAVFREPPEAVEAMVREADRLMYAAKQDARVKIRIGQPGPAAGD